MTAWISKTAAAYVLDHDGPLIALDNRPWGHGQQVQVDATSELQAWLEGEVARGQVVIGPSHTRETLALNRAADAVHEARRGRELT